MTALLDAATIAEGLVDGTATYDREAIAAALRLLAKHARESEAGDMVRTSTAVKTIEYVAGGSYAQGVADERARASAKRITIVMGADEANVLLDGEEIQEIGERDPKDEYIFGIGLVAFIVRALGGTIELVDGRYPDDSPIAELVAALDKIGFLVPVAADWTNEINLRQVDRLDSAEVKAAVANVRAALAAKEGPTS